MQQAPKAPTIADLLGQRSVAPVTSAQDEARRMFAERMSAIRGTASLPQALSDVGGHIANAIMARKDMARAKETDQAATAAEGERRQRIAEMLTGAGYAPEQAVGFATASPDETALVASLTGMKRQEQAAADDRAWRESQAAVDADRFAQNLALKRQQFDADQALKRQQLALASRPNEPAAIQTLRAAGIDPSSAEGQRIIRDSLTGAAEGQNATQFGSIPAGMARVADPNEEAGYRLVPLRGSKEQVKAAELEEKRLGAQAAAEQDLGSITRDINRVLTMSREGAGGPIEGQVGQLPGIGALTQSGQMAKHLESIKANIAFGELQEMRNNSPTGGAVGALTDKEREALSATVGSLDPALPEADLQKNLADYGVQRITAVHGTDAQIDAAVASGKITPEQAAEGKAIRDQQIAAMRGGARPAPSFSPDQIQSLEAEGEALERQYINNGMDPREAEQLVASELRKRYGL